MTVKVTEDALRALVNEALDGKSDEVFGVGSMVANINPVVDPSAAETDKLNVTQRPQNKVELGVAIKSATKHMPDEDAPRVYDLVTKALDKDEEKKDSDMEASEKEKSSPEERKKAEAVIRSRVRAIVQEMFMTQLNDGQGAQAGEGDEEDKVPDEQTFAQIASELGFSVAGAKRAVDEAIRKAQFLAKMDPDDLEIMVLRAMKEYINYLNKSGELTQDDVDLMMSHPEIVRDLDGFREYLQKHIKRARRQEKNEEN